MTYHENRTDEGILAEDITSICDYAVNGALFYGKHLIKIQDTQKLLL